MALSLWPHLVKTWVNQGFALSNSSNYIESIQSFLNAVALNPAEHVWEYLHRACINARRTDLVELCKNKNLDAFRIEFSFLDPNHMPAPSLEVLSSHPFINEPINPTELWSLMP